MSGSLLPLQEPKPHFVLRFDSFSSKGCWQTGQAASPFGVQLRKRANEAPTCLFSLLFAMRLEAGWLHIPWQGCRGWWQICYVTVVQVLDEIGVDVSAQMGSAPTKKLATQQNAPSVQQDEENDSLTARLAALK